MELLEDTFEPDRSITQSRICKIIVNALLLTGEIKDLITNKILLVTSQATYGLPLYWNCESSWFLVQGIQIKSLLQINLSQEKRLPSFYQSWLM